MYYRHLVFHILSCGWALLILVGCGGYETTSSAPATQTAILPKPIPKPLTITFENHECTYDGPRPISAGTEISAYATIKDTDIPGSVPVVGITALTINEGYTIQDVEKDFRGIGGNIGVGVYQTAGSVEVLASSSKQFDVRPTKGPLYFVCFIDPMSKNFFLIGPIEVVSAVP